MHLLFAQVLAQRDLSRAGDLFSIDDKEIVDDLSEVLMTIKDISSSEDYLNNDNDQAVVEICITRVTTAIKETGSINDNATALVLLWQSCLEYNLKPINRDEDSPHAKIASDIMSCLFMNYSNKAVMELAVPVAVKFLEQGNKEITRNMSSYLSLVAIESASLLARHTIPIIQSIVKGKSSKPSVPIELGKIQSVKTLRKRDRSIPRAFEIFTNERTYVLKPKDGQNAEQWVQCLTLAMRHHACKGTFNTS
uniref:Ventricular zone-expressed PH domain-containing protein homolog 1-like n=1 Tax=Saccoglossus kowalevskii TaxID=10224 RepID=A0ABM0GZ20_SACKO|nr:PREDICTED: ventricular zone-expressed PH domain-containing protein homolog 1-like [Saccoglossus kowalevskii]